MAIDDVTPMGPNAALPQRTDSDALLAALLAMAARVEFERERILNVMGIVSCAKDALPAPSAADPLVGRALMAAYDILDSVCAELDPANFAVAHVG